MATPMNTSMNEAEAGASSRGEAFISLDRRLANEMQPENMHPECR
jgi:hypothetical protein